MRDFVNQTIASLSGAMERGELDAVELTRCYLERIDGVGKALNCYITVSADRALGQAAAASARAKAHRRLGPLDGVPIALKDNIDVAGQPSSNGFGGVHPPATEDAEVVRRLKAAGAVILGKLNMQEGALGAVNDNAHHGRATNPWRTDYTPGGSSGGSGAAVAAGLCAAALGTDTGGSVRIPAAYCGVVGLKPSFGLASTRGVAPLFWRLDHVGPLTCTVTDAGLMLATMAGYDPACTESRKPPDANSADETPASLAGSRLGIVRDFGGEVVESSVSAVFERSLEKLRAAGATIIPLDLPGLDTTRARRAAFVAVEVGAALAFGDLYRREPHRFSAEMRGYLDWGAKAPAVRLLEAERVMDAVAFAVASAWDRVDAIVSPSTPQTAFPFMAKVPDNQGAFCVAANVSGCPAISIPAGLAANGLPVGLHLMAPLYADRELLGLALAVENALATGERPSVALPSPYGSSEPLAK